MHRQPALLSIGRAPTVEDPRSARPTLSVVVAFALAVAAFVTANVVALSRLGSVSVRSKAIWTDAMPAVIELTTLRERLGELVTSLNRAADEGDASLPAFDRTIADVDQQMTAYEARPVTAAERQRWDRARGLLSECEAAARRVRATVQAGRLTDAHALLESDLRPRASAASTELWQLADLRATDGERSAHDVDQLLWSARLLTVVLDVACVLLAAALTALALRAVSRHARVLELRSQELELFAARVAHDVRGPLAPVALALQHLGRDAPPDDPRRFWIDRATRSVGRVTSLVEDLLAFATAGGHADRTARADVLAVVRGSIDDAGHLASRSAVELSMAPCDGGAIAACPPGVLASLVSNLVQNAIKYMGEARERRVVVRCADVGACIRVEVEDTGPGLPAGAAESVFDPYVRADRTGQPGLGLGLATVKRLAEAYGGSVGVLSRTTGSAFWFELPAAKETGGGSAAPG